MSKKSAVDAYEIITDNHKNLIEKKITSIEITNSRQNRLHVFIGGFEYRFDRKLTIAERYGRCIHLLQAFEFCESESYRCVKARCTGRIHLYFDKEGKIIGFSFFNPHNHEDLVSGKRRLKRKNEEDENAKKDVSESCSNKKAKIDPITQTCSVNEEILNDEKATKKSYYKHKRRETKMLSAIEKVYGFKEGKSNENIDNFKTANNNIVKSDTKTSKTKLKKTMNKSLEKSLNRDLTSQTFVCGMALGMWLMKMIIQSSSSEAT